MIRPPSPLNLSLRQLRAFATIARQQSFTRAAEQLHITQPGLSGMVRDIEAQLECRLFERTTRAVSLTEHGRAFLPVAMRVLAELDTAAASLSQLSDTGRRRLVVGATPVIASSIVPEACAAFARTHPGVQVVVHDLDRAQIQAGVQDGELDAGFGVFLDASSGLRRTPLHRTHLVLVAPGTEPADSVRWSELSSGLPLLSLPAKNPIQKLVNSQLKSPNPGEAQVFNHLHTLLAMVEAGLGRAVLPSFVVAAATRYRVTLRPLVRPKVHLDFYEITRAGAPRPALLVEFGKCLLATKRAPS
ncbi:MAG: LysR family transcriptional regulator [Gammaproteobacteria bacterium]|nr:LysR family transcriptional regulator [Gammaproteobacteria bacterium]MBU1439779.1 LysR family transcriptional regulator [Gammaproteobacteria bacterium]MBU2289021.1 LysR family transcriptional regulator [Gammaproteobacteria bacterium]